MVITAQGPKEQLIETGTFPDVLKWDRQGRYLAVIQNGEIRIWSASTKTASKLITHNTAKCLEWSPIHDKSLLAVTSKNVIELWDVRTHTCLHTFNMKLSKISRFSPEGQYLACVGEEGGVTLCNTLTWQILTSLKDKVKGRTVEWSPDGERIAILTEDSQIVMLDVNLMLSAESETTADINTEPHSDTDTFSKLITMLTKYNLYEIIITAWMWQQMCGENF